MALVVNQTSPNLIYTSERLLACIETNLSVNDLEKKGFPKETLETLRKGYTLALESYKIDPVSDGLYLTMNQSFKEVFQVFEQLPTILRKGNRVQIDGQWKKCSPEEYLPHLIDQFYCLKGTLIAKYPKDHPLAKLSNEIDHLLVSLFCKKHNLESSTFLSLPLTHNKGYKGFLICTKESDFWSVCIRDAESKHSYVEISQNRGILLDESFQPIDRPCLSAIFQHNVLDKNTEKMFVRGLETGNKAPMNPNQLSAYFQFTYYTGRPQSNGLPNAWTYTAILQSNGSYELFSPDGITPCQFSRSAEEYVSAYLDSNKEDILEKFKQNITIRPSYLFYVPNSEAELKFLERQILEEIAKNPEEHVETIQWLLDNTYLPLLEGSPTEEEVSTKKGIELLLETYPDVKISSINPGIDSSFIQKDAERRQQVEKDTNHCIKSQNAGKPSKKHIKTKKPNVKQPNAKTKLGKRISLSTEERSQVRQVMQGHSMKGDDFVKFGLTLLKRKVEKLNLRQAGSHINAARQTLVRIHRNGRKDLQGMVSHQKSFLREVLQSSDN